jgi:hypothetical protein
VPVQAFVYGDDPRPEVVALIERYKQKFKDGPVTEFAFPASCNCGLRRWRRPAQSMRQRW